MIRLAALALTLVVSLAVPLTAQSLCDVRDPDRINAALQGVWTQSGGGSYVTASEEAVAPVMGNITIGPNGQVTWDELTYVLLPVVAPELGDAVYDVDNIDDLLETTESEWIVDTLSDTPCGPENLPQLSVRYEMITLNLRGQLTLVPYFEDRVLAVLETEWKGDWGIAFITVTSLMTRP